MEFRITITDEADSQFKSLTVREQRIVEAAVAARLLYQPTVLSHAIKLLKPNSLAQFELRVGDLRILYNVEETTAEVVLLIIGRKVGNKLVVGGQEFHEHQPDSTEPTTDESGGHTQ